MIQDTSSTIDPRILGQRLQAARKSADLTQQEVAASTGLARTTIVAIEKGDRLPRDEEILQFSQLYHRPVHELLRQHIPSEPLVVQFRASRRLDAKLDKEIEAKLREFQELCDDYLTLEHVIGSRLPHSQAPVYTLQGLEGIAPGRLGEGAAASERNRLGLGDAPILNLREVLEKEGLRIFQLKLPSRVSGFFGYTQALGPCIAINSDHPAERRQWSLAHEYAHFLAQRHEVSISVYYSYQHVPEGERFADAFAKAFLMPTSSVHRHFLEAKRMRGSILPADLIQLAHFFFVSFEAMARRLEDLQLIRPGMYDSIIRKGFKPQEALSLLDLKPHVISDEMFPLRYKYLATEAFSKGMMTEEEYARFLRTDLVKARYLFLKIRTQLVVTDAGEDTIVEVPFNESI
jgi:Zn-dependent peptidase ImmA (M78 family)/transcriptional regulator with XRE-family HTH domain